MSALAVYSPFVAQGLALRQAIEEAVEKRDLAAKALAERQAALDALNAQLVALGAGRYRAGDPEIPSPSDPTALVIAAIEPVLQPDTYCLPATVDGEAIARQLAKDAFSTIFDRIVRWTPCEGFSGVVPKLLTPARARDLLALCRIPGKLAGGRVAHVRWK